MQWSYILGLGLAFSAALVSGIVVLPHFNPQDLQSLQSVFVKAIQNPPDLAGAHYAVNGLQLLGAAVPDAQKLCQYAQKELDNTNIESLYHASGLASKIPNCKLDTAGAQALIEGKAYAAGASSLTLLFASFAAKQLNLKLDQAKIVAALKTSVKEDDSAASLGYAFHAATTLSGNLDAFFDRIEDAVAQADEVDKKYLQFEGGLSITAIVVSGVYGLADKVGKSPTIKADEAIKLTNFLLSRKGVQLVRPAFHLLNALKILTVNKYHIPVSVSLASKVALSPAEPTVSIKACNVLGESVGPLSLSIDSATHVPTSGVVLSKKQMTVSPKDGTIYTFNFLEGKREKGFYKLLLNAGSADKRLIGTQGAELSVKVMSELTVTDVTFSIMDREQTTAGKVNNIAPPRRISGVLDADSHNKLAMKFTVKEKSTDQPIVVHQAFVVFVHQDTNQEIVFVAEPDKQKIYSFDADLQKAAKEFDNLSGKYQMRLIIGDSVVNNPMDWLVADLKLKFPSVAKKEEGTGVNYAPRPEIRHLFREPEKRAPAALSSAFTILTLVPVPLLIILWLRIGINISNFPASLFSLGFHVGLAGIFGLYYVFWLQLNMFQTLKYLAGIGLITFLCGNKMLRGIAERRKGKTVE